ncbi:DUF4302 domain-containing protein [Porphyromonas sp.]|uniref:DUF4302 domain-containing protein n=1 Tax=Porphyromonas sp. TaxID=1924944 RepID=UPI0026DB1141|nr:DUF4302 domain-containing protein [Porphyromonas sp.]MDO4771272.1 DUF4302 domain-containing protein [Porphyromonas sp.]
MKTYGIYALLTFVVLFSSCKEEGAFSHSPSERSALSISTLRKELTETPHGWKVTYFSKTDSLIFADLNAKIVETRYEQEYGVGGHYFHMKFDPKGTVQIRADYDETSASKIQESEYEIKQNTFTQLSFTTYNYLHKLVDDTFSASPDFLYIGKDLDGNLRFRTPSYFESAGEYILFEKVTSPEEEQSLVSTALANRLFFEGMRYPQIKIHKGDRVYFDSNYFFKYDDSFATWIKKSSQKRYRVFLYNKSLLRERLDLIGLGSGYTGTDRGLSFQTGFRFNKTFIFRDFERVGDRFVCELVRVYDPKTRIWRYKSKHLAPDGEPTGMIAEICNRE